MAAEDCTSDNARELCDLQAEAVGALGVHLASIGGLISKAPLPPKKGERGTAKKVQERYDDYKAYCEDVTRRKKELQAKMAEDLRRLREWRKEAGTEGASMVEEIERLYILVRDLKKQLQDEKKSVYDSRQKVQMLLKVVEKKDQRLKHAAEQYVKQVLSAKEAKIKSALTSSWLQYKFDEIMFRWKAEDERKNLLIEHHRGMRKKAAQGRIDVIGRERTKRLLQMCMLAFQEEAVENRANRLLEELRLEHSDKVLVMEAQLAQALGDDEKAKALIAEQVRRIEDEKQKARDLEKELKIKKQELRKWKEKAEELEDALAKMTELQARTQATLEATQAYLAKKDQEFMEERAAKEQVIRERDAECAAKEKAQELARKKQKRIDYLMAQLAELGADSDSDAPPDERAPPFFVNSDGKKEPRPRTKKERTNMARREAETARIELKLGIASMIDKDLANKHEIGLLRDELQTSQREVQEVRWANKVLSKEAEEAALGLEQERQLRVGGGSASSSSLLVPPSTIGASSSALALTSRWAVDTGTSASTRVPDTSMATEEFSVHAPLPAPPTVPFSPSASATTPFSPTRPSFVPGATSASWDGVQGRSPRLLVKAPSQPVLMPSLHGGEPSMTAPTELAPLRKVKKANIPNYSAGWH